MAHVGSVDAPFVQKPVAVLDRAFDLYGFLPVDQDPRWQFLARYESLMRAARFSPMNFTNAWRATYLSETVSFGSGFVNSVNPENNVQIERALDNLAHVPAVADRYQATQGKYGGYAMQLSTTDRLTTDPTKPAQEVTPCPEALHQIRLYDGRYLARVGFNIHTEQDTSIVSIVNIQGTPGGRGRNATFSQEHGISPFNLLVKRVVSLATAEDPNYQVRGMTNPERGNPQLYGYVLAEENLAMYTAVRK